MRLGVDVDLTLVNTGYEWWSWLTQQYSNREFYYLDDTYNNDGKLSYDLTKYFIDCSEKIKGNQFDFWKQENLYDYLKPLPNSVEVLKQLVEAGHDIVFISHTHGGHFKSKVDWLKKHFPFTDIGGKGGFIATKEKWLVNVDTMIDDRIENLLSFPDKTIKIYFNTIYADKEFVRNDVDMITSVENGWLDIKDYFEGVGIL